MKRTAAVIVGVVFLSIIAVVALLKGVDGTTLLTIVGGIPTIIAYLLKKKCDETKLEATRERRADDYANKGRG